MDLQEVETLARNLSSMVKDENVKEGLIHVTTLAVALQSAKREPSEDGHRTLEDVQDAHLFLQLSEGRCPEALAKCFQVGVGRERLTSAKRVLAQRAVDESSLARN